MTTENKPKPEKKIVLSFYPDKDWVCTMKGLISLRDINRLRRIIRVSYRKHRLNQRLAIAKGTENANV